MSVPPHRGSPHHNGRQPGDNAAVGNRERPMFELPRSTRTCCSKELAPVTVNNLLRARVNCRCWRAGRGERRPPTVCDRKRARAKTADVEPALWSVDPAGARAGHRHRAIRADSQSDGAAGTTHRAAVLDCKVPVPWPPTTTELTFVQLEPAPVTVTVPSPPGRLPIVANPLTNVPPVWIVSIPVPFESTRDCWFRARARNQRRICVSES
jgi:hypothetical protein